MITIKLASRLRDEGIVAVMLHPGHLRTAMGGAAAAMDADDAARQIVDLIDGFDDRRHRQLPTLGRIRPPLVDHIGRRLRDEQSRRPPYCCVERRLTLGVGGDHAHLQPFAGGVGDNASSI